MTIFLLILGIVLGFIWLLGIVVFFGIWYWARAENAFEPIDGAIFLAILFWPFWIPFAFSKKYKKKNKR